ncbi:hypothetical protein DPMN_184724 [Dreissena polymorpha]|uniref:Uncharacterized protein n=1 Tax=Dreissena polymorpha TaxID=45954 RepID=A0A9D4I6M8_DREPO|nr:hypothetical protein DPMN_184724 [Dreissena polymorpha]
MGKKFHQKPTYRNIHTLAGTCRSHKEDGFLVLYQKVHDVGVPYGIHGRYDDLIKHHVLGYGRRVLQLFCPRYPLSCSL